MILIVVLDGTTPMKNKLVNRIVNRVRRLLNLPIPPELCPAAQAMLDALRVKSDWANVYVLGNDHIQLRYIPTHKTYAASVSAFEEGATFVGSFLSDKERYIIGCAMMDVWEYNNALQEAHDDVKRASEIQTLQNCLLAEFSNNKKE